MLLSIHLDMSFKIVFQELAAVILVQSVDEPLEHLRNRIFTPIEELRCDIGSWFVKATDSV